MTTLRQTIMRAMPKMLTDHTRQPASPSTGRNVEIKARVQNPRLLRQRALKLATAPSQVLHQEDVFFRAAVGRLKLRILSDTAGELIHYQRPDVPGCKESRYKIVETPTPNETRHLLADALGEAIVVKKRREVIFVGQTRIHLDEVEGLGSFMELEVVLQPGQAASDGEKIAAELVHRLGVKEADLVTGAYADLLAAGDGQ
jgi:predicted adenylyl cyclase CyaB